MIPMVNGHQINAISSLSISATQLKIGYPFIPGKDIKNPSRAPVRNGIHPSEFVFQKSRAIASDFCGIQTHEGELPSRMGAPDRFYFFHNVFFLVITSQKTSEITLKSWDIAASGRKSQMSVEEMNILSNQLNKGSRNIQECMVTV